MFNLPLDHTAKVDDWPRNLRDFSRARKHFWVHVGVAMDTEIEERGPLSEGEETQGMAAMKAVSIDWLALERAIEEQDRSESPPPPSPPPAPRARTLSVEEDVRSPRSTTLRSLLRRKGISKEKSLDKNLISAPFSGSASPPLSSSPPYSKAKAHRRRASTGTPKPEILLASTMTASRSLAARLSTVRSSSMPSPR